MLASDDDPPTIEAVGETLRATARTLSGIAARVGRDAASATDLARRTADDARQSAELVATLAMLASDVQQAIRAQADLLTVARDAARDGEIVVVHLADAVEGIGAISGLIGDIATRSRLLALNARIEAARTGDGGRGFDVVANEMKHLSQATWDANRRIETHTDALTGDVGAVRRLCDETLARTQEQQRLDETVADIAARQGDVARTAAELTQRAVDAAEEATMCIGRVASSAATVDVIARQLVNAANQLGPAGAAAA